MRRQYDFGRFPWCLAVFLVAACFVASTQAAVYDWVGTAGDGDWDNVANWSVTDSTYLFPNEQWAGGGKTEYTNEDCGLINLTNGDTVTRDYWLSIHSYTLSYTKWVSNSKNNIANFYL